VPSTRILLSSWLIEVNTIARRSEALVAETIAVAALHTEAVRRSRAFFAAVAARTTLIESSRQIGLAANESIPFSPTLLSLTN
jgi:hypothetical protein